MNDEALVIIGLFLGFAVAGTVTFLVLLPLIGVPLRRPWRWAANKVLHVNRPKSA